MTIADVAETLGVGGREIHSDLALVEAVRRGLPPSAVDAVVRSGMLSAREAEALVIPRRTLTHRKQRNEPLTPEESDRLTRIVRVTAVANESFGDPERAARWLRKPNRALGGLVPIDLLATGEGGRIVEESILRLAHGIFA